MRLAVVHPWYLANGGAEQTVNVLAFLYPEADFFTLLYREKDLPANLRGRNIQALSLNWIPGKYQIYRHMLPFYPLAFESLDLRGYDVVVSSDSCVAKGIIVDQHAFHLCYCHSPMRCLWDAHRQFYLSMPKPIRPLFTLGTHYVRQWDFNAAQRVDTFVANSNNVASRISKFYRRDSTVIYPPVDTSAGYLSHNNEDYYLSVGRLTETKRVDLLITACNELNRKLIVVGVGRDYSRLRGMAGPTITFAGRVSQEELSHLYANCRAFLFAADEDFGIVPVEAQSFGRPVVAYGVGGSLETVIPINERTTHHPTGVFFSSQATGSVIDGILNFEKNDAVFKPKHIQQHARRFDTEVFSERIMSLIASPLRPNHPNETRAPAYA